MSTVVVATSAADAQAVEAVKDHHAQLAGALAVQVEALVDAAARGDLPGAGAASDALVGWCRAELIPHALSEWIGDAGFKRFEDGIGWYHFPSDILPSAQGTTVVAGLHVMAEGVPLAK